MFGGNRQIYYLRVRRKKAHQQIVMEVISLVQEIPTNQPRIVTRKLYYLLYDKLLVLKVARDNFFDILRANHLLIIPKRTYQIAVMSYHRFSKHPNTIKELNINRPHQVWISDITYIGKHV